MHCKLHRNIFKHNKHLYFLYTVGNRRFHRIDKKQKEIIIFLKGNKKSGYRKRGKVIKRRCFVYRFIQYDIRKCDKENKRNGGRMIF